VFTPYLNAQSIQGVVCDQETRKPVADVHVYLDGTSIHTITDKSGKFELNAKKLLLNTHLVLKHVSYELALIPNPFWSGIDTLFLKEELNPIEEVVIRTDRFSRKQKLKAFREQFLGNTRGGKACKILNEKDIQLVYHPNSRTLSAYADHPVIVRNSYLGYEIEFQLDEFRIMYSNDNTLESDYAKSVSLMGPRSFKDLSPENSIIKKRRDLSYQTSPRNFFHHLANQTLSTAGFKLYYETESKQEIPDSLKNKSSGTLLTLLGSNAKLKTSVEFPPDSCFIVKDISPLKTIILNPDFEFTQEDTGIEEKVYADIKILHNDLWSRTFFLTDSFMVDPYGNTDRIKKIIFSWRYQWYRVGEMLPLDYQLSE
jgi:hypothetical protein